ncbi:MAG: exodeoxyribonuclease VII large subunit [Syntrophaceae bacterium]|nr:exodeoxyribonuclease VII large subunit [Syntrophaceae bacterium]
MKEILTVSQLNYNIKDLLEEVFGFVWVEGEISNLRRPQSGHTYFTLKDDKSQIRAVYFKPFGRPKYQPADFELEEGLSVLCRARLSVYPPRGEYQLIVESVEPRGVGALQKAFEQLKARLASEGLFDERHKKRIPFLPQKIGVVTSPTGAVIKDILHVTRRRFPSIDLLIAPCRVQGTEAADEIIQGLRKLHATGNVDVIIIARGGGSLEDLAPFNNEALAREIFHSRIPVISAVGHETDFTICDFVADLRAPTPSAAAELAVPDASELTARVGGLQTRLLDSRGRLMADKLSHVMELQERLKNPRLILIDLQIHLDDLRERSQGAWRWTTQSLRNRIQQMEIHLQHRSPKGTIAEKRFLLNNYQKDILNNYNSLMTARKERLHKNLALLNSLSPLNVLERGYSITRSLVSGEIIREATQLECGQAVNVRLAKGSFQAKVEKISVE